VQLARGADPNPELLCESAPCPFRNRAVDDVEDGADVRGVAAEIFRRQPPQRDHGDLELAAPAQHFLGLCSASPIPVELRETGLPRVAAMAILDESQVPRHAAANDLAEQMCFVESVEKTRQHVRSRFTARSAWRAENGQPSRRSARRAPRAAGQCRTIDGVRGSSVRMRLADRRSIASFRASHERPYPARIVGGRRPAVTRRVHQIAGLTGRSTGGWRMSRARSRATSVTTMSPRATIVSM